METAMRKFWQFIICIFLILTLLELNCSIADAVDMSSHSFVYNYGNARIWVFIEANSTLIVSPNHNGTILFTVYIEELGNNKAVFLNRITFEFDSTMLKKTVSPNVTFQEDKLSWSYVVNFDQKDISDILIPGQTLGGEMNFEFRYDILDFTEQFWPFRVNEEFPLEFANGEQSNQPWINQAMIFIIVLLVGSVSVVVLLWVRIRKYKNAQKVVRTKHHQILNFFQQNGTKTRFF
jgi:hypothetical protein